MRILSRRGQTQKFDIRGSRWGSALFAGVLCLILGACASGGNTGSSGGSSSGGSSGSSSGSSGGTPTPTPTVNYNTAEYQANWGLNAINAITAYNDGATGQGITVAVIDSGLDTTHSEFLNHYDPASINIADSTNPNDLTDVDGHGTLVSGIIAAKRDDVGMHGVAFDANLLAIKADDPGSCTANASTSTCNFYDSDIAAGVNYAAAHGAKVINISLGGDNAATSQLQTAMANAVQQGIIIVIASGNDYDAVAGTGNNPTLFAQFANDARANGQIIIAGAAKRFPSIQIADYSNRAGNSQTVYILAPADGVDTTSNDGGYTTMFGGSSLATPHVVGAAALLLQAFPNLTAQQVVQLLLTTATDLGAAGPDTINGMGFLNIAAAFAPQGTVTVTLSPQTTSTGTVQTMAVDASMLSLGPAFGDALGVGTATLDTVGLDSYSRAYRIDLGTRVTQLSRRGLWSRNLIDGYDTAWATTRLSPNVSIDTVMFDAKQDAPVWRGLDRDWRRRQGLVEDRGRVSSHFSLGKVARWTLTAGELGRQSLSQGQDPGAHFLTGLSVDTPYLSLVERGTGLLQQINVAKGLSVVTAAEFGKRRNRFGQDDIGMTAVSTGLRIAGKNYVITPKAGFVSEHGGILGGAGVGLFQFDSTALTQFVGLDAHLRLNGVWSLHANGTAGWTSVNGTQGLWAGFSTISTSAFRLFATGDALFKAGDRLTLGVGQPLRVESGRADLVLPTSYDYGTQSFGYATQPLSLSPSGREIDFEMVYALPLGNGWSARANLVRREDAGHIAGLTDTAAALQFHVGW